LKVTLLQSPFGILAFKENNTILDSVLFAKNSAIAAAKIMELENGKLIKELETLVERLKKKGCKHFVLENSNLAKNVSERFKVEAETVKVSEAGNFLREKMGEIAVNLGFSENLEQFREWVHKVSMELTKLRVKKAVEKRDLLIIQAIQTIDDLDKTANLFMGRIREWYGLHFPELNRLIDKHETYARIVSNLGARENFTPENLEKQGLPESNVKKIVEAAQTSMGAELTQNDINEIQSLCKMALELYDRRQSLEKYVDSAMEEVAPNIRALVGSFLGARLIALTGGLNNLAKKPASTIQVLGAEKALFRALKTGTRPPKHGIIFQHAILRDAKKWQRGKIARALAGKLAIAARADAFGGKYMGNELTADLEKRTKEIQEKYEEPPRKPEPKKLRRRKRGR